MRRVAPPFFIGLVVVTLTGCFTTTADFADDAENYIRTDVAAELKVEFDTVDCEEPESQDVGVWFECTAIDSDGGTWVFDNEISAKNVFEVNVDRRP
jgi:hypothetical protein